MMEALLSRESINDKGTFNVHLAGGSPWGFTLHGGREFNSKLCISKVCASFSHSVQRLRYTLVRMPPFGKHLVEL